MINNYDSFALSLRCIYNENPMALVDESVSDRNVFYRLGDSEVFQYANKNTMVGGDKLVDVIPHVVMEDQGFMHIGYDQFDKTVQYELFEGPHYKISCKKMLKELISKGIIVPVYSDTYKLPTCIPFIILGSGSSTKIFVNVSDFVNLDQYGRFQINQPRNYNALMASIFSAAVAYRIIQSGSAIPADLADGMVLVYASMMERVMNSIGQLDPITKDKIRYLATEFALIQMYGTEDGQGMFLRRFKNAYFPKLNRMISDSIDAQFHLDSFDHLSSFVLEIQRLFPGLKGITEYKIYEKWIRLYGASTTLSIDYLGYQLYTICMVLFESPLISRMALEPVMEKNKGVEMYKRMQMMIGNT